MAPTQPAVIPLAEVTKRVNDLLGWVGYVGADAVGEFLRSMSEGVVEEAVLRVDSTAVGWYQTVEYVSAATCTNVPVGDMVPKGPSWKGVRIVGDVDEFLNAVAAVLRLDRKAEPSMSFEVTASGADLDKLAHLQGTAREPYETDHQLRLRVRLVMLNRRVFVTAP